jgi:hypothetical protein
VTLQSRTPSLTPLITSSRHSVGDVPPLLVPTILFSHQSGVSANVLAVSTLQQ